MTDWMSDLERRWKAWKSSPQAPGDPTYIDLLRAADAELMEAADQGEIVFITNAVDVAQGYDPAHDPSFRDYAANPFATDEVDRGPGYYQIDGQRRHRATKIRRAIKVRP